VHASRDQAREQRFDAIYAEHRDVLFAYFLGRTADREQALDLLQEAFIRAWRSMHNLESLPSEKCRYWLFSVARNLVVDQYRGAAARGRAMAGLEPRIDRSPAPDEELLANEQVQILDAALSRLPEDLRIVLVLQALGEQTSTEIGAMLGKPAGTVRYQIAQARRRLGEDPQLAMELTNQ
jgi:RNA polymerase sigma-70 factor (ECF subfamily)